MNLSAVEVALVPLGVVTVMSWTPVPAGEVIRMEVAETTVRAVPATVPNLTLVAPVKLVPVKVTTVPPAVGPEAGVIDVITGGDG